jgi:hypothetical protein
VTVTGTAGSLVKNAGFTLTVDAGTSPLTLVSASSRRTHGSTGDFDLNLPLAGNPGVEPRSVTAGVPQLVLNFDQLPVADDGNLSCNEISLVNATCQSVVLSGNALIVRHTPAPNACVTVTVSGLAGLTGNATFSFLVHGGNANGDAQVNLVDINLLKIELFRSLTADNFVCDVNADGGINLMDLSDAKANMFVPTNCAPQ